MLVILTTHPIQYQVPIWQMLAIITKKPVAKAPAKKTAAKKTDSSEDVPF